MTTKLFVFGCSYATGEELLMHELGAADVYRCLTDLHVDQKSQKHKLTHPKKFFDKLKKENLFEAYEKIREKQKKIAWPQQLAEKLNYECINLAESGNSLDKMLFQLYNEIYNGSIRKEDIVIISLTQLTRNAYFNETVETFQLPSLMWPTKGLIGVADTGDYKPVINQKTDEALIDWFTDDRILWDGIKNLQAFKNLKQFFNIHLVPAMYYQVKTNIPLLKNIYEDCSKGFITDKHLDNFSNIRHAWGHPDITAHNGYADHLYEIFRKL
jgi:hypothetical protein